MNHANGNAFMTFISRVFEHGAQPNPWVSLVTILLFTYLFLNHTTARVLNHGITIVHEAGHGFIGMSCGRKLRGIRLHADGSGLTTSAGYSGGLGDILTSAAGYTAASSLGVLGAWIVSLGYGSAVLWLDILLLTFVLLQIRNWFGLWSVLVAGVVVFTLTWFTPAVYHAAVAVAISALLLIGGIFSTLNLRRARRAQVRAQGFSESDADAMAKLTHLPAPFWVWFFILYTVLAAAGAVWLTVVGYLH